VPCAFVPVCLNTLDCCCHQVCSEKIQFETPVGITKTHKNQFCTEWLIEGEHVLLWIWQTAVSVVCWNPLWFSHWKWQWFQWNEIDFGSSCLHFGICIPEDYTGLDDNKYIGDIVAEFKNTREKNKGELLQCKLLFKKRLFRESDEAITEPMFIQLSYVQVRLAFPKCLSQSRLKDEIWGQKSIAHTVSPLGFSCTAMV
jgi:hypothetical protein